ELEAAVGLRARAGDDAGAARRTVRGAVLRPQRRRPRDRRQRGSLGGAGPCLRLFQQVRVLLLHRAGAAARRIARHAGALHRGSGPAGQHPHADALVYLLQERIADRRARRVLTHANGRPTMAHPSTAAHAAHDPNVYYVPHGSRWPLFASVALFITMVGFSGWLNEAAWGKPTFFVGIAGLVGILFKWFADVITESVRGYYNKQVDGSFRMGMIWFIFSEVMFFGAFFGALFYARQFAMPWLGGSGDGVMTNTLLWPEFTAGWPSNGPGNIGGTYQTIPAWGLPLV